MKLLSRYQNGNLITELYDDGTRIRTTLDDEFRPAFAENVDVHISSRCDNGCKMCYANCTPDGKFGVLEGWNFLETLHRGTEMALNLNFPIHPHLLDFLKFLKDKGVIVNVTVNQNHFMQNQEVIKQLYRDELIHGLGISLTYSGDRFIEMVQRFPNAVIHVINGLFSEDEFNTLKNKQLKLLILGYKDLGRGVEYHDAKADSIAANQQWLYNNLKQVTASFAVTSFDNLALNQLDVKRLLTDEEWEQFYSGDDGSFTFFINLVEGYFAKNSLSMKHYPINDLSMDEMFEIVRAES